MKIICFQYWGGGIILCNFLDEKTYMREKTFFFFLSLLRYKFPIYIPIEDLLINVNMLICIIALSSEVRMYQLCVLFIVVMSASDLTFDLIITSGT